MVENGTVQQRNCSLGCLSAGRRPPKGRNQRAAELLQRMLDAGLPRYEHDPLVALERAAKRQPAKKVTGASPP